jgi:cytochrome c-type biogenesis protein CcmH
MNDSISETREQLLRLRSRLAAGELAQQAYDDARLPLERRLVDAVLAAASAMPAAAAAAPAVPEATPRAGAGLWATAAAVVLVVGAGGYAWTGNPGALGQPPAAFTAAGAPAPAEGNAAPHAPGGEQLEAMIAKLADRLKAQPDDAEGWGILGRSYAALGRHDEAFTAYEKAYKLRPTDPSTLADYADALGVKNGRTLDGEPTRLLELALKADPDHLKALALAGTAAFNRGDFATAVKYWDHAVAVGPPDSGLVDLARGGAAEARERGKLPPPAAAPVAAAAPGAGVSGTVTLAASLKAQASPEDTVFIFARAAEGSRMPLAILKKQVKDLPFTFKLDDSQSMSPSARLSTAKRVIVGARVSKSGQAAPQPGDLEGMSKPVDVGAAGVAVEIGAKL